jgi:hypothetical protein
MRDAFTLGMYVVRLARLMPVNHSEHESKRFPMSDSFTPSGFPSGQNVLPAGFSGITQNDLAIISAKHG